MNILIIDDDKVDRMLFKHFIQDIYPSAIIDEASNATSGLQKIKQNKYGCMFIDFILPDMDGIDLLKKIYDPKTELTPYPTIILTGQGHESIIIDAIKYGAQDYIAKGNLSTSSLNSAIQKAQHVFKIKQSQNEANARLNQAQKIDALGQLTGGIAHDFNNILTIIIGNAHLLKFDLEKHDNIDKSYIDKVSAISRAAQRGADLVQHLMVFSHQRSMKKAHTNINTTLNDMLDMLQRSITNTINISMNLSEDLWMSDIDTAQFEHMIINMCVNSRDAMEDGGIFSIETKNTTLDTKTTAPYGIPEGNYVRLTLCDTGSGIPEDIQKDIFDPFFTTKEAGKGTGLGMSMAFGFVKDSGGIINLRESTKSGTIFDIYFPQSINVQKEKEKETKIHNKTTSDKTILIVEDEEEIRGLAKIILQQQGYKILCAPNADRALEILIDYDNHVDILFTDLIMPGEINGVQLAARALDLREDLNILFTTGFIKDSIPDINLLEEYSVLDKPYDKNGLLNAINCAFLEQEK